MFESSLQMQTQFKWKKEKEKKRLWRLNVINDRKNMDFSL